MYGHIIFTLIKMHHLFLTCSIFWGKRTIICLSVDVKAHTQIFTQLIFSHMPRSFCFWSVLLYQAKLYTIHTIFWKYTYIHWEIKLQKSTTIFIVLILTKFKCVFSRPFVFHNAKNCIGSLFLFNASKNSTLYIFSNSHYLFRRHKW